MDEMIASMFPVQKLHRSVCWKIHALGKVSIMVVFMLIQRDDASAREDKN